MTRKRKRHVELSLYTPLAPSGFSLAGPLQNWHGQRVRDKVCQPHNNVLTCHQHYEVNIEHTTLTIVPGKIEKGLDDLSQNSHNAQTIAQAMTLRCTLCSVPDYLCCNHVAGRGEQLLVSCRLCVMCWPVALPCSRTWRSRQQP